ncbi:TetR/AcrR family transcriptional regulator [Azohydromonas australica]|uniref:TetR/AcrR family transcriptional regulator n=1 Tax=Azohydromonas australica TaxID=364039 RepID=UPI000421BB34|nr:TetR/AcrR family transcriptional regulator [Azohydromonas australica]
MVAFKSSARVSRPAAAAAPAGIAAQAPDTQGRVNQRRRTQRALIEAVLALHDEGAQPTFAEVAERALVSRATAYRYYASVEALLSEALFERSVPPLDEVFRPGDDPVQAIGRAVRDFNRLLVQDEAALHVMERSFMSVWLDNTPDARPPRPARRLQYIGPLVEALRNELPPAARKRLAQALAMVAGPEAVLSLRDVAGATVEEVLDASAWAAMALVQAARAQTAGAGTREAPDASGHRPDTLNSKALESNFPATPRRPPDAP